MFILFSPSEAKNYPTTRHIAQTTQNASITNNKNKTQKQDTNKSPNTQKELQMLFSHATYKQEAIRAYLQTLKVCDNATICNIFGSKSPKLEDLVLCQNLLKESKMPAITLYSGVAYKALNFENLELDSQNFILQNVLICSNLFGFVRASDKLPFYNLHQNKGFGAFELKTLYKAQKNDMDALLENHSVLDLRAQAYIKVYEPSIPHIRAEFLHNGKTLSHYAKHYRGLYLRSLALTFGSDNRHSGSNYPTPSDNLLATNGNHSANDKQPTLDNLENLAFENLTLKDITHKKHIKTLVYEIMQK